MKYFSTILFLSFYNLINAQAFGALGSEWNHCFVPFFEFPITHENVRVKSTEAFEMNGLECNVLEIKERSNRLFTLDSISICRDGDKVYYLELDSLHLLYDFSLEAGSSYKVRYPILFDTTFQNNWPNESIHTTIFIDSVTIENVNGLDLRKQHIHQDEYGLIFFGSHALERIGFEYWMLPFYSLQAFDGSYINGLESYQDDDLMINNISAPCLLTNYKYLDRDDESIEIFPNPSINEVELHNVSNYEKLEVFNFDGKMVYHSMLGRTTATKIDISDLPKGMYLLKLEGKDEVCVRKLLKQ